ncbi:unnamed protein product [Dibothriocephalus latus]|uniref:Ig-like domain-containing protein n=1 Tax=Dibothriocephalus latus TaxID=60516 RepID=A0A3P7LBW5_DIBLA|nr:unnamed protein product [Dibothriocephalus latus]
MANRIDLFVQTFKLAELATRILLVYACGQLQEESMLYHFEADEYVQEGNEWCMWFVPKNARAIRDIKVYKNDSLKLDCAYSPEAPPWIELSFKCSKGCVSIFCAPSDPYGLRIDGHIWHVYVRNASSNLQGTYTLQVDFHGNHRDVHEGRLEVTKPPKIRPGDINCSDPHFKDALRSPSAEILEEKHFRKTINKDPLTEGERMHGEIILSLGVPKGKAEVYIVKLLRNGNESELLTCDSNIADLNEALGFPNPAKLTFDCLLTVEHVGLLIVAANVLRNDPKKPFTTDSALQAVKTAALNSVTLWLTKTKPEIPEFEGIYGFARRLVQLFVGWPAVVPLGSTARFICSFPDGKVINAKCWRDKHVNELGRSTRIPSPKNHGTYFEATLENAQYNDSGVYTCSASRCDLEKGCITRPICRDRRLYISKPTVTFKTYIGRDYSSTFYMFNKSYGARNYADAPEKVYTKETLILLCSVPEEEIGKGGKITLKYTHYDPVTNIPTELEVIPNRQETQSRQERWHSWGSQDYIWVSYVNHYYLLGKTPMPMYAGLHIAECQMTYSPSKEELPDWMRDPNDKNGNRLLRILGSKSAHIEFYQGATGELQFESKTPYFEEHPVPLGTSVRCKGGTGFPLLKHSWSLINPLQNESYKKYASSLPLPYWKTERVFRDIDNFQPPNMINGDTVTIPYNSTLRGVSFLFLCEGTNTDFHGKAYTIPRRLHLTVCICTDERMKKIDISMIVSPQLLPSVKMEGHSGEMERIDFYGRRYLTLLRQIILGLPQSSELARISIVPTTILGDLKRHPLYRKALDFRHNLTRHQLVEGLISENIRPASLFISENSCPYKYRVRMDEAIQAIPETFSTARSRGMRKRPHIILYPMDPWNQIDSPSIAEKILHKLQGEGSELVKVYFLNKSHAVWEDNTHGFSSSHTVDLMPQAKYGSKKCEDAMSDNDEAGFIDRLAMFNKICELAVSAKIKDARTPGFLYFSLPYRMQLLSAKITISCMSRLDPFGAYKRQMRLCLANYDAVRTYKVGKSSVEDLDKTCVKHLLTTDFSKPEDRCIALHYEMVLEDSHNGLFAVCYRRTQDMAKELATFAFRPIRLTSIPLTDPVLVVVHWPMKSVERQLTAFTLGQINQKGSVRLIWREIPPNADEADIYCLISRPGINATNFTALPNITATIKVSKSERRRFLGGCPREPVIKTLFSQPHSNEAASPKLGNQMYLSCEADTGVENAPIQMAYADKETRFVICNHPTQRDLTGVVKDQLEINLDCWFADWNKGGCFQQPNAMYSKPELVNFTACKIKRQPKYYSSIRTIELEIPLLRIEHFGGFVFCETVPRRFVGKKIPAKRLLSKYLENYFEVEPQILSMEVSLLDWNCLVIANPPASETSLETIEAYPQSLRRALAEPHLRTSYNNKSLMWQMSKEAANFFPTDYLKSVNDANSSMLSIVSLYRPPPNPERTTEGGLATVECSVTQKDGENSRTASRRIHITYPRSSKMSRLPSGTTLIPSSGVVEQGSSWGIRCTLPSNFRITALYAYLLYKADLEGWGFVGVPLVRIKVQTDVELGKRVRVESFRPVGLWMKKPLDDLTVTLLSSGGKNIIEIMIKKAKVSFSFCFLLAWSVTLFIPFFLGLSLEICLFCRAYQLISCGTHPNVYIISVNV